MDFFLDILLALPLELSVKVLKCLTAAETIRLRLVSKGYYGFMTSEEVCSSLSYHFIHPGYNATKNLASWRFHYENHISRRLSFASGKPWAVEIIRTSCVSECRSFCPETLCLASAPATSGCSVIVQDLNRYPTELVLPPTRTPDGSAIIRVALLPLFVVVVTRKGDCYVWNLETRQRHQFRLPRPGLAVMHGSGNLVAMALPGLIIVHDVQAQKTSTFKDTGDGVRVRGGTKSSVLHVDTFVIPTTEKQAVWVIRGSYQPPNDPLLVVADRLDLETGGIVQGEFHHFPRCRGRFRRGMDLWRFLEDNRFGCHPVLRTTRTQAVFDQAAGHQAFGRRTSEPEAATFLGSVTGTGLCGCFFGPATGSDGLGCFSLGEPLFGAWVLSQEPPDWEGCTRPLDLSNIRLRDHTITSEWALCIGLCDRFILFHVGPSRQAYVVWFKGIHDNYGYGYNV